MASHSRAELEDELAIQQVILSSLDGETFEGVESERTEARQEIARLQRLLKATTSDDAADINPQPQTGGKSCLKLLGPLCSFGNPRRVRNPAVHPPLAGEIPSCRLTSGLRADLNAVQGFHENSKNDSDSNPCASESSNTGSELNYRDQNTVGPPRGMSFLCHYVLPPSHSPSLVGLVWHCPRKPHSEIP